MRLPTWVDELDEAADGAIEGVRGTPAIDATMNWITNAAEFSKLWHAIGIIRGAVLREPQQAVALSAALGIESVIVNQGIKRLFGRQRPTDTGDDRYEIRAPVTSSFPSGHASSAWFAATILTGWDGKRSWWWYGPLAALVSLSRPYVRIHHASDVVGGAAVGLGLGWIARLILRRLGLMGRSKSARSPATA